MCVCVCVYVYYVRGMQVTEFFGTSQLYAEDQCRMLEKYLIGTVSISESETLR